MIRACCVHVGMTAASTAVPVYRVPEQTSTQPPCQTLARRTCYVVLSANICDAWATPRTISPKVLGEWAGQVEEVRHVERRGRLAHVTRLLRDVDVTATNQAAPALRRPWLPPSRASMSWCG